MMGFGKSFLLILAGLLLVSCGDRFESVTGATITFGGDEIESGQQIPGLPENPVVEGNETRVSRDLSTLAASPEDGVRADCESTSTITVRLLDDAGLPVSGVRVEILASGADPFLAYVNQVSNTDGYVIALISSSVPESITVSARVTIGEGERVLLENATVEFLLVPGPENMRFRNVEIQLKSCSWDVVWEHPDGWSGGGLQYEICSELVGYAYGPNCTLLAPGILDKSYNGINQETTKRYTVTAIEMTSGSRLGSASRIRTCGLD